MDYLRLTNLLGINGFLTDKQYIGSCPFHPDNNPSFTVNIDSGLWICYKGCGSGDFIRLVERTLNYSPLQARQWIQNEGDPNNFDTTNKTVVDSLEVKDLFEEHEEVDRSWEDYFKRLTSDSMPQWFLNRGFTWKTIDAWNIRFDIFNDAVVVPVYHNTKLVGTVTRNHKQDLPKYKNSPKLPGSSLLFGKLDEGKINVILVEGLLDTIWLWQNGYNAAGLLGDRISEQQIEILKKYHYGEIILGLDNDEAGRKGTEQAVRALENRGWFGPQLTRLEYPEGIKDTQDCSPDLLVKVIESRKGCYGFL